MRYFSARNLLLAGLCAVIAGFLYDMNFAGLPFQDPTPQMQNNWLFHKNIASKIILAGFIIVLIGFLMLLINVISRFAKGRG